VKGGGELTLLLSVAGVAPSSEGICWKLEMTRSKTRIEQGLSCLG
jgi:hypothetical protein